MVYDTEACNIGIIELLNSNFSVFPIPAKNELYAQINGINIIAYTLTNQLGQVVEQSNGINLPTLKINTSRLSSGHYTISVSTEKGTVHKSIILD
jgi:hypothetical protein